MKRECLGEKRLQTVKLKIIIFRECLSIVWCKGGISSYSLLLLVSFLQLHPRTAANESSANLGVLLIEFFELYRRNFNYRKTAISVLDGGSYFPKEEDSESALLYIQDPAKPEENAGASCYGMWQVKQVFDNAYLRLHSNVITRDNPVPRTESLLSTIIQVSEEVRVSCTPSRVRYLQPMRPLLQYNL